MSLPDNGAPRSTLVERMASTHSNESSVMSPQARSRGPTWVATSGHPGFIFSFILHSLIYTQKYWHETQCIEILNL